MAPAKNPPSTPRVLVSIPEAAQLLSVGRSTIYNLINQGLIAPVRIGRSVRIRPADLDELAQELQSTSTGGEQQ